MYAAVHECRPSGPRHSQRSPARPPQATLFWSTTGQGVPQSTAGRQRFWAVGEAVVPGATTARWRDPGGKEGKTLNALGTPCTLHLHLGLDHGVSHPSATSASRHITAALETRCMRGLRRAAERARDA